MSEIIYKTIFKLKRGNSKTLALKNIILAEGEPCYEVDTNKLKIGNGKQQYNDLPYIVDLSSFLMKEQYAQDLILLDELVTDLQNQISDNYDELNEKISNNAQKITTLEEEKANKDDVKTLSETIQELKKEAIELPKVTTKDIGKFLRVSSTGVWEAQTVENAEEVAY